MTYLNPIYTEVGLLFVDPFSMPSTIGQKSVSSLLVFTSKSPTHTILISVDPFALWSCSGKITTMTLGDLPQMVSVLSHGLRCLYRFMNRSSKLRKKNKVESLNHNPTKWNQSNQQLSRIMRAKTIEFVKIQLPFVNKCRSMCLFVFFFSQMLP